MAKVTACSHSLSYLIHENCCSIDEGEAKKFYVFLGITILGPDISAFGCLKWGGVYGTLNEKIDSVLFFESWEKLELKAAYRISQIEMRSPRPMTWPCTTAMTGNGARSGAPMVLADQ
jgi:hypothetical protein